MALIDSDLAANRDVGTYTPFQLFAGEVDPVTTDYPCAAATTLEKYRVVGVIAATGLIVPHDPAASDGSQFAVGIACQPKAATTGNKQVSIYVAGCFNHAALVWNAATDTVAERKAAFARTPILIEEIDG
jgi:hypothetical protein